MKHTVYVELIMSYMCLPAMKLELAGWLVKSHMSSNMSL